MRFDRGHVVINEQVMCAYSYMEIFLELFQYCVLRVREDKVKERCCFPHSLMLRPCMPLYFEVRGEELAKPDDPVPNSV